MRRIVVVGDVGVDVLVRPLSPPVSGGDVPARTVLRPGGAGANTAAWLARLGAPVTLIGRVGADEAGRTAVAALAADGVDCRIAVDSDRETCCVVVLLDADGERTMLSDRGAAGHLAAVDIALPDEPGHLHLSGYVLADTGSRPAGLAALAIAQAAGWSTSVDPQPVTAARAGQLLADLDGVDVLLPNESELAALGGADRVLARVGAIAVTGGAAGASWLTRAETVRVAAPPTRVTDSTGAGDAFNAGWLTGWLAGAEPTTALTAGIEAASGAVREIGARAMHPTGS